MLEASDLEYKNFEKETHKIAGKTQLKLYGNFLEKHNEDLTNLEYNLQKHVNLSDPMYNLIDIQFEAWEDLSILQLVQSDNKIFSKVLASLASVCEEAKILTEQGKQKFFNELLFYGKDSDGGKLNLDNLSKLLELLQNLCGSIKCARELITLIIQQLVAITQKESKIPIKTSNIFYMDVCESLADILVYIVIIENLLNNPVIKNSWATYKRTSRTAQHSHKVFQLPLDQLRAFDKLLYQIESILLTDKIFQNTIEACLDDRSKLIGKNSNFGDELMTYLTNVLADLERNDESLDRIQNWLRINTLTVFHFHMFGNAEKKYVKHLLEFNKKMCAATLVGNLLWYPEQFLSRHIPNLLQIFDERYVQSTVVQRQAYLTNKAQNILKDTLTLCHQTCNWILQLDKMVKDGKTSQMKLADCQQRCTLFMNGITLAHTITHTLRWITNIHAAEGKPINRTVLMCIFRLNSLVKGILYTFKLHFDKINHCISIIIQYLQYQVLSITFNLKKSMTQDKSYKDKNLDVITALRIAEQSLSAPPTDRRLLIIRLSLAATMTIADNVYGQIRNRLQQIYILINCNRKLIEFCDVSFIYWHQMLLRVYFQTIFDSKVDMSKVLYTFYGINDCLETLTPEDSSTFIKYLESSFDEKLMLPLCQTIEINLRLQTHAHLQVDAPNPFETNSAHVRSLLEMKPIRIADHFLYIKTNTENYLSTTFYNLATVVLHDWHTYGEMRRLAYFKHKLDTVEDYLPNQTLEQGLDGLEIMRNIHVFVSKYLYNLNNQVFIEQCSNNKHLNTINIRHLANSIRMHGIGIMNTTVNFTYQFLRKKFLLFSQFMYDEHIKSRLIKDIRYFRENKTELDQMYPFDRAEKFNKSIRKLGVTANGESFLDLFRVLISHIGNAMGYIRMIRSGGRHFCGNAIAFLPNSDTNYQFELENCSKRTVKSAEQLLKQIETLTEHFDEKTEYFKLLVEVFAPVFRNPKNMHLRNFYAIVPPLTINFVEHTLFCKERLNKKNKEGASFTDDGFAMGVAYILKLLEQDTEMNSLHWFQSVRQKYMRDKQQLLQQKTDVNKDDLKLQQTLPLTEKRIVKYQQEFDLLYYNLNSARIFFQ